MIFPEALILAVEPRSRLSAVIPPEPDSVPVCKVSAPLMVSGPVILTTELPLPVLIVRSCNVLPPLANISEPERLPDDITIILDEEDPLILPDPVVTLPPALIVRSWPLSESVPDVSASVPFTLRLDDSVTLPLRFKVTLCNPEPDNSPPAMVEEVVYVTL